MTLPAFAPAGKEDPWVRPIWGQRLKRRLPSATYLELSPAGHCPHHEAPAAVNRAARAWVAAQEGNGALGLALGESWDVTEADGRVVRVSHIEGKPRSLGERLDNWVWGHLGRALGAVGAGSEGQQAAAR